MSRLRLTVLAGAGAAVGLYLLAPRPAPPVGPVARVPATVELGDCQPGTVVEADFPLAHVGDQPLVVSGIGTSCSCAGLEWERDGRRERVTALTVPPGATAPLRFQVAVSATPGRSQTVRIGFRTNDPARPAVDVPATVRRVVGQPFARPASVHLGAVRVGRPRDAVVDLLPNAVPGVRVVRAVSSQPDAVTATLEPPAGADPDEPGGAAVGRVRVAAAADRTADLDARVTVELAGPGGPLPSVEVRVGGRVRQAVECRPATARLMSEATTLYLVGADDTPFTAAVTDVPAGLTAAVEPEPPLGGRQQARLVLARAAGLAPAGVVRLTVRHGGGPPFDLEVPVSCPAL